MRAAWPVDDNSPLYPSGIRTEVKIDTEGNPAEFIIMTEDGSPLRPDRIYTVAMNSYMTQVYSYEHADPGQSLFFTTADALITYLKKHTELRSYRGEKRVKITR